MRNTGLLVLILCLCGCSAMLVGGGTATGSSPANSSVQASDAALAGAVRDRFAADARLSGQAIDVRVYKGTVTLTGSVASYAEREQAGKLASDTGGVRAVNNQIVVNR